MTNFIGEYLIDTNICDEIIEFHKNSPKKKGVVGYNMIDDSCKQSNDVSMMPGKSALFDRYIKEHLKPCVKKYIETYIWSSDEYHPPFDVVEGANVQHYEPGGGFKVWHFEQSFFTGDTTSEIPSINHIPSMALRHLVYMTYLNDVTDEGETEFYYQGRYVQPRKGLTLIWPAGWTHTHRGVPSKTQDKYIITGWISYVARR